MDWQDTYTQVGSVKVHYVVSGEGPPVILVHGLAASLSMWAENIPALAQRHRVYALDLPGYGDSDKPKELEYSAIAGAHFLPRFMDRLGIGKAILIGNSAGGLIAALCALNYSHRVEKLVLVDAAGLGRGVRWALRFASIPLIGELIHKHTVPDSRALFNELFYAPVSVEPNLAQEVLRVRNLAAAKRATLQSLRSGVNFLGLREKVRVLPGLKKLPIPLLIIWGEEDRVIPVAQAHQAARYLTNSQVHIIPQCGHWPQMEKPREFNARVLDFLANSTAKPL